MRSKYAKRSHYDNGKEKTEAMNVILAMYPNKRMADFLRFLLQ